MEPRRAATFIGIAGVVLLAAWLGWRGGASAPEPTEPEPEPLVPKPVVHEAEPPPPRPPRPDKDLPMRIEIRVGVHLSAAFGSGTRVDRHLETLDDALISRLDLYAHARPGSALTLWEDDAQQLVAAAVPLNDGARFLVGRYADDDAPDGWYDARGFLLDSPVERRPVPLSYVTSAFGERLHPLLGVKMLHHGVDYGAPEGTPVRTVADGVVSSFVISESAGIAVEVAHADGFLSRYLHLQGVTPKAVVRTKVSAGDVIGYVGSTGRATGPHLHYELLREGVLLDAAGVLPPSAARLPPRALKAHQARLRELVMAQLQEPTVPNWRPSATVSAPPPPEAFGPLPEEVLLSPEEERRRDSAELEADRRAEARALARLEAKLLAEAEREARARETAMAEAEAELEAEREREARELARVAEEAREERLAEEEARRKARERAEARREARRKARAGQRAQ